MYNLKPIEDLLTDQYSPDQVAKLLDRVITNYLMALLACECTEIPKKRTQEEFYLLTELRDKTRECKPVN